MQIDNISIHKDDNQKNQEMTYPIQGRSFVIHSVFKGNDASSIASILLRLMQLDIENNI